MFGGGAVPFKAGPTLLRREGLLIRGLHYPQAKEYLTNQAGAFRGSWGENTGTGTGALRGFILALLAEVARGSAQGSYRSIGFGWLLGGGLRVKV